MGTASDGSQRCFDGTLPSPGKPDAAFAGEPGHPVLRQQEAQGPAESGGLGDPLDRSQRGPRDTLRRLN